MNAEEAKMLLNYFAPSFENEVGITKKVIQNHEPNEPKEPKRPSKS